MPKWKKLYKAEFWSGCIDEAEAETWAREKQAWLDGKFGRGLCDPECEYFPIGEIERETTECPEGGTEFKYTARGYCRCPD